MSAQIKPKSGVTSHCMTFISKLILLILIQINNFITTRLYWFLNYNNLLVMSLIICSAFKLEQFIGDELVCLFLLKLLISVT